MMRIVIVLLLLMLIPIILVTLGASFVFMDASLLNPANWGQDTRGVSMIWCGIVLFIALFGQAG